MFNNKETHAFTLVELIVVIVILAILATIAFLSFSSQSGSARDSKRLADISSIKKGFEMYNVNSGFYPVPDGAVPILYSGGIVWNQGTIGDNAYRLISKTLSKKVFDPISSKEYDYSLASNRREYQVAGNFENPTSFEKSYNPFESISKTFALGGTGANVYISGNYNGVLLKVFTGSTYYYIPTPTLFGTNPASASNIVFNSSFNTGTVILPGVNSLASYKSDSIYSTGGSSLSSSDITALMNKLQSAYSGSNITAAAVVQIASADSATLTSLGNGLVKNFLGGNTNNPVNVSGPKGTSSIDAALSCNDIKIVYPTSTDGNYWLNPTGTGSFQAYCDMTNDGGGWTRLNANVSNIERLTFNGSDQIIGANNPDIACGGSNYNYKINGIKVSYTDIKLILDRTTVTQCSGIREYNDMSAYLTGANFYYLNGVTWLSHNSVCTWGDSIWAKNTSNVDISGLPTKWKLFAKKSTIKPDSFIFKTTCNSASDNGTFTNTVYIK